MEHLTLDVGCGSRPRGHVNVDLYPRRSEHRPQYDINLHKVPNFVKATINHLPFKDNAFFKTVSVSVLEHKGVHFYEALNEMLRVSSSYVEFRVPSHFNMKMRPGKHKGHQHVFTARMLHQTLKGYSHEIMVEHMGRLWRVVPIYVPLAWTAKVWKR